MGLFQIEATITSVGASQHDLSGRVYSFIELTEASGAVSGSRGSGFHRRWMFISNRVRQEYSILTD
jgi:hypothetical protein